MANDNSHDSNGKLAPEIISAIHDIKNPLTALKLKINLIQGLLKKNGSIPPSIGLEEMMQKMESDVERTLKELDRLRDVLVKGKLAKSQCAL